MLLRLFYLCVFIILALSVTAVYHVTQTADRNYYYARTSFEKGAFSQAIPFYEKCLAAEPSRIDALVELADSYRWTDNFAKAILLLNEAISDQPNNPEIRKKLAETYVWNKQYELAIPLYVAMLQSNEDDADIQKRLAEVYVWAKEYEKAGSILRALYARYPDDSEIQLLLAKLLHYSGNAKDAIVLYKQILREKNEE